MLRVVLVLAGMLVALPTFANPPCSHCNIDIMQCEADAPATGIVCRDTDCQERQVNCHPSFSPQLAQDMTIASVEVVTPQRHTITTSAKTVRIAAAKLR
jgi:hypothetical protein